MFVVVVDAHHFTQTVSIIILLLLFLLSPQYSEDAPDTSCYSTGWPACCEADASSCPKEKPECSIVSGGFTSRQLDLTQLAKDFANSLFDDLFCGAGLLCNTDKFIVRWPAGLYNITKDEEEYEAIGRVDYTRVDDMCQKVAATDTSSPISIFACRVWEPASATDQPIALGPFKMTTNMASAYTFKRNELTQIFKPYAFAAMIEKGCFYFNRGQPFYNMKTIKFTDESSYESSIQEGSSISVDAEASYGPVAVSAGYSKSNEQSTSRSGNRKTSYGEKRYFKNIGTLDNLCK